MNKGSWLLQTLHSIWVLSVFWILAILNTCIIVFQCGFNFAFLVCMTCNVKQLLNSFNFVKIYKILEVTIFKNNYRIVTCDGPLLQCQHFNDYGQILAYRSAKFRLQF